MDFAKEMSEWPFPYYGLEIGKFMIWVIVRHQIGNIFSKYDFFEKFPFSRMTHWILFNVMMLIWYYRTCGTLLAVRFTKY